MEAGLVDRPWAVVLPIASASSLATLRHVAGLQVRQVDDCVWLRGASLAAPFRQRLLSLPALQRYFIDDDEELTPWDCITPCANLPAGAWVELRDWATAALPQCGWPGARPAAARLGLIRSGTPRLAGALLCSWPTWAKYVASAPQIRLGGLAFIVNGAERVVVRGSTLPPLPGQQLTDDAGILMTAGWSWFPHVEAAIVRGVLGLCDGESALWLSGDQWERIPADAWVAATRSAVRETAREVAHG